MSTEMKKLIIGGTEYEIVDDAGRTRITALEQGGGGSGTGLTQTEKNLILELFEKAEYTEDTSATLNALNTLWTGSAYSVTWIGTGYSKSNSADSVGNGETFTSTITANTGFVIEDVSATMGGTEVIGAWSSGTVTIPNVTGDIVITVSTQSLPAVQTDVNSLSISSGGTGTIGVKMRYAISENRVVSLNSDSLTLSTASLTFTPANWGTYQSVTITAPSVNDLTYAYITLTDSDQQMTESTVMVAISAPSYSDLVDTTIPTTGQYTLTASDFTSTQDTTIDGQTYIRLYGYNGAYSNVVMPAEMDGKKTLTCGATSGASVSNSSFATNTTIEYVTFENGCRFGEGGSPASNKASSAFSGCTSLIGVSNMPTSVVSLSNAFLGCTALRFIDNLDELVNVTEAYQTFKQSGIQYVQDLSDWTSLTRVQAMFQQSGLIKIFGMPELNTTSAVATNMYANCTALTHGIIPKGVNAATYAFYSDTALRQVEIYADDIPTSGITSTTFYQCTNLKVYCNDNTTTEASLLSAYGSSTNVTILNFGSASLSPSIVVWGDSISSPNKLWIEWPKRLQTQLGTGSYLVKNEALAGEGSPSTTARQGGYAMTTSAFTIPATTTAAELTITVDGTETFSGGGADMSPNAGIFSAGASFNPCTISGVVGNISRSGSTYYFTRLEAGTAVNVSAGTVITSNNDTVFNNSENVMLFYLNGNAGWHNDADVLLGMFQDAVSHFTALGGTKYIVAGPAANVILTNSTTKAEVLEFEGKAATAFGSHWLNLREYEIQNGLSQNGLTASALDTERMADGLVPASLVGGGDTTNIIMYDGVTNTDQNHPNVYGANTIMLAFYEKGVALGYWT